MTTDVKLDCYAVLGLAANADDAAIRAAFAALTQQYDPQRFPGGADEAQRKLSELATAYGILADPARRRRYDFHRRISTLTAEFDTKDAAPRRDPAYAAGNPVAATARPRRSLAWYALIAAMLLAIAYGFFQYSSRPTVTRSPDPTAPAMINARPAAEAPATAAEAPPSIAAPQVPAAAPQDAKPANTKPGPANPQGNAPAATAPEACTDVLTALGLCKTKPTQKDK